MVGTEVDISAADAPEPLVGGGVGDDEEDEDEEELDAGGTAGGGGAKTMVDDEDEGAAAVDEDPVTLSVVATVLLPLRDSVVRDSTEAKKR